METLKTFQTVLNEGYQFPTKIDVATRELITEWFQFRLVCDNDKFTSFFNRTLNLNYDYYRQLLRIDPTTASFDWLIVNYNEHESNQHTQTTGNGQTGVDSTTINKNSNSVISAGNSTSNTTVSNTDQTNTKTDTKTHGDNEGFTRATVLSRVSPMSADYTSDEMNARNSDKITVGDSSLSGFATKMPRADISNPSATSDNLTEDGRLTSDASNTTGETTGKSSGTTENVDTTNGTTTSDYTGTVGNNSLTKATSSNETSGLTRDITSGRSQSIAELLGQARGYILNSRAWIYLYKALDMCFMQDYLESEE